MAGRQSVNTQEKEQSSDVLKIAGHHTGKKNVPKIGTFPETRGTGRQVVKTQGKGEILNPLGFSQHGRQVVKTQEKEEVGQADLLSTHGRSATHFFQLDVINLMFFALLWLWKEERRKVR